MCINNTCIYLTSKFNLYFIYMGNSKNLKSYLSPDELNYVASLFETFSKVKNEEQFKQAKFKIDVNKVENIKKKLGDVISKYNFNSVLEIFKKSIDEAVNNKGMDKRIPTKSLNVGPNMNIDKIAERSAPQVQMGGLGNSAKGIVTILKMFYYNADSYGVVVGTFISFVTIMFTYIFLFIYLDTIDIYSSGETMTLKKLLKKNAIVGLLINKLIELRKHLRSRFPTQINNVEFREPQNVYVAQPFDLEYNTNSIAYITRGDVIPTDAEETLMNYLDELRTLQNRTFRLRHLDQERSDEIAILERDLNNLSQPAVLENPVVFINDENVSQVIITDAVRIDNKTKNTVILFAEYFLLILSCIGINDDDVYNIVNRGGYKKRRTMKIRKRIAHSIKNKKYNKRKTTRK